MDLKPKSEVSPAYPARSHIDELKSNEAPGAQEEWEGGGDKKRKGREREKFLLPSVSDWESHLLSVNSNNFFEGSFLISFPFFFFFPPSEPNPVLHFLCNRSDPTLQVESKGRKAVPSVLVIKRICIMNHMPKGPVLRVGQIFVWIFNFYIQMKRSV